MKAEGHEIAGSSQPRDREARLKLADMKGMGRFTIY
jgi:hypothetical protein